MKIIMTGVDHERAPIEAREALSFDRQQTLAELPLLVRETGLTEGVLISTCNRTEFYGVAGDQGPCADPAAVLSRTRGLPPGGLFWNRLEDQQAVEHLFGVAAGLCSMVKGEAQVLGQVKEAFRNAVDAMATGPVLNRLFHAAFRAGKRVRSETCISEGAVSVSQAAVELASREARSPISDSRVLVIGAGVMARLVLKHLASKGARNVTVANRTPSRAEELAGEFGAGACGLQDLGRCVAEADVVFSAVNSDGYLVGPQHVEGRPETAPIYLIDIGIPRTVDPAIGDGPSRVLRNIDSLNGVVADNKRRREEAARRGWEIVRQEAGSAMSWIAARRNASLIHSLAAYMEEVREREIRRVRRESGMSEEEKLQNLSNQLIRKLTEPLIRKMNEAASAGDQAALENYHRMVKDLFRIG